MDEIYIDALKALADPNRLRLFWLLIHVNDRICVAEAMDVLDESQYNVSRNLKILHKAKLLEQQKEGKWVFYTLKNQKKQYMHKLVESVKEMPSNGFTKEKKRCQLRLSMRKGNQCVVGANSEEWKKINAY